MAGAPTTFPNSVVVQGDLSISGSLAIPASAVTDTAIIANAKVQASKIQQRRNKAYSQPGASSAAAERKVIHVVYGATGTVLAFNVGAKTAALGGATVVLDLQKNGTSILTGTITLDNTTTAYALKAGSIATAGLVAGDVLEVVVTSPTTGGGTLAAGLFANLVVNEDAQ